MSSAGVHKLAPPRPPRRTVYTADDLRRAQRPPPTPIPGSGQWVGGGDPDIFGPVCSALSLPMALVLGLFCDLCAFVLWNDEPRPGRGSRPDTPEPDPR